MIFRDGINAEGLKQGLVLTLDYSKKRDLVMSWKLHLPLGKTTTSRTAVDGQSI